MPRIKIGVWYNVNVCQCDIRALVKANQSKSVSWHRATWLARSLLWRHFEIRKPIQLRKQDGNDEASWLRKSQVDKHPTLELATREVANPWWYSYSPSSRDGFKPLRASTSTRLCAWNSPWARSEQGTLHPNAVVQMRPQKRRTKLPPLRRSCDGWQFQCPYAEVRGWSYVLIWVSPCRYACSQSTSGL